MISEIAATPVLLQEIPLDGGAWWAAMLGPKVDWLQRQAQPRPAVISENMSQGLWDRVHFLRLTFKLKDG